jgi:3-deoxy-D-arabino-heptulosonate 7-phosphate (DAHP) synthase class II
MRQGFLLKGGDCYEAFKEFKVDHVMRMCVTPTNVFGPHL